MSEADNRMEELADRVERASGADRESDIEIHLAAGFTLVKVAPNERYHGLRAWVDPKGERVGWREGASEYPPHYTASLDAAMSLVPEGAGIGFQVARGAGMQGTAGVWCVSTNADDYGENRLPCPLWSTSSTAATPALALTAACLRARALSDPRP